MIDDSRGLSMSPVKRLFGEPGDRPAGGIGEGPFAETDQAAMGVMDGTKNGHETDRRTSHVFESACPRA